MDYIDGLPASTLKQRTDCDVDLYGTPEQDIHFRKQMADIHAELANCVFDQIGSLLYDEQTGFTIGPDVETGFGPWRSSLEYFNDIADHSFRTFLASIDDDRKLRWHRTCSLPLVFKQLTRIYCTETNGPFHLINRDFGAHNLLVNEKFEIVGVIDFDSLMAAPVEMVAQFPRLTGLDRPIPWGLMEKLPAAIEREKRTAPQLKQYAQLLKEAEERLAPNPRSNGSISFSKLMLSDAASVIQGLEEYGSADLNNRWMDLYLMMLRKKYLGMQHELFEKEHS